MTQKVVIVGAGLGGLATAGYLAKAGFEVHVYEQLDYIGGRVGVLEAEGFRFDIGPSWYLMPEVFEHYFDLMGTTAADQLKLVRLDPAYKVFFGSGDPISIGSDQQKNRDVFESIEPGAGEKLRKYAAQASDTYDTALRHFLYTNFQSLTDVLKLDIIKKSPNLTRLALTTYDREVSRFFKDSRLKRVLEYSAVFLGASPFAASGIYTLMGALDYRDGVYYPKGGIAKLADRMSELAEQVGVKFYLSSGVKSIDVEDGRACGITLETGEKVVADIVISNADLHFTETRLLNKENQTYPEKYWSKRNAGPSSLMIYLGVRGKLPQLEHHDLLFVDEWRQNFDAIYNTKKVPRPASIYISRATATDPEYAPDGHESLVVLVPFPSGVSISDAEYETIADNYIKDIERMTGIKDLFDRIVFRKLMTPNEFGSRYNSWNLNSIGPAHTLRQTGIFRTGNVSKKVKNLYYVGGATIPGVGMPMVIIGAELVYKRIIGDRNGGQVTEIKDKRL